LLAEEAKTTLREHEAVEGRRGHKASNVSRSPARKTATRFARQRGARG